MTQTAQVASQKSADLMWREGAIMMIKAIEARHGLASVLANKRDRRLLDLLDSQPGMRARLEMALAHDNGRVAVED